MNERFQKLQDLGTWEKFLWQEVSSRLLEKLEWIRIEPQKIVVLGWDRDFIPLLQKCYPFAEIFSLLSLESIPDHSVDFIFSNLYLPWCEEVEGLFAELARVLKSGGLFLFSAFGANTQIFEPVAFPDFHDLGDLLMHHGFKDPVMVSEMLALEYASCEKLEREFSCMALDFFAEFPREIHLPVSLDLEIVLGHAWRGSPVNAERPLNFVRKKA